MTYGLRIRNDAGEIQIDDKWKTLRVRESGTVVLGGIRRFVTLTSGCTPLDAPLFATHSTERHCCAHTPVVDENFLTDIDLNSVFVELTIQRAGGTGNNAKWLVVDANTPAPTTDTHGLVVRNAAGESVFDSRQDLVLIRDVLLINPRPLGEYTYAHAACRGTPYYVSGLRQAFTFPFGLEPVLYTMSLGPDSVSVFHQAGNMPGFLPNPVPLLVLDVFD